MEPSGKTLAGHRFRANRRYALVLFDRLSSGDRQRFAVLRSDPDFYGVLCPRNGRGPAKAISRETALLYFTLREPGLLPEYFLQALDTECEPTIAQLVLDGVLEMEISPGALVTGPAARAHLVASTGMRFGDHEPDARAHPLALLSRAAVRYGGSLSLTDPIELSLRLYQFNRIPLSPEWRSRFPTRKSVVQWLGLAPEGAIARRLERDYAAVVPDKSNLRWQMWRRRTARLRAVGTHKLYVSPVPGELPATLEAVAGMLGQHAVPAFKVGNDLGGTLRPDKLVIYLSDEDQLGALGDGLRRQLAGIAAHGVPFTAPLGDDGLLSWGTDPPPRAHVSPWRRLSWRLFLTDRLGSALASALAAPSDVPAWRFALERLTLDGVDTQRWLATPALWRAPATTQ